TPPNDKGILNAMKSMKTIIGQDMNKAGQSNMTPSFPRPPIDFVGKMGKATKKNNVKAIQKKKPSVATKKKPGVSTTPPPPSPAIAQPTPVVKPDTNSQLFGTLVNLLKTCPVDQMDSVGRSKTKKNTVKDGKKVTAKKGYASSSSSSSSMPSVSTSSSNRSSISSVSSRSSTRSDTVSSALSGSRSSAGSSGKIARKKKKRKEELLHEKVEMLTRITNLSKNGFTVTKEWNIKDDVDEIRYECYRMQRESNSKKSIKIMRRVLVTITTLVETGNAYFNPFNLRLEGFSESMMLNLDDYDDCYEQIHHKYSGRSSVGPEMQIMFTFTSAAIFHHAGNAIGRSRGHDSTEKRKPSPSPMSSVMNMMGMLNSANSASSKNYPIPRSTPPTKDPPAPDSRTPEPDKLRRKTMRGPGTSAIPTSIFGNDQTTPSMTLPPEA
ncbi:unnamed protein product, partial [Sphacelaria rigidula]